MWCDKPYIPWCLVWHWNIPIYGSHLKYWCLVFTCTFMCNWMFQYSILYDAVSVLSYAVFVQCCMLHLCSVTCYIGAVCCDISGIFYSVVSLCQSNQSSSCVLPVGSFQQRHSVSVWWSDAPCLLFYLLCVNSCSIYCVLALATSHRGYDVRSPVSLEDTTSGVLCH